MEKVKEEHRKIWKWLPNLKGFFKSSALPILNGIHQLILKMKGKKRQKLKDFVEICFGKSMNKTKVRDSSKDLVIWGKILRENFTIFLNNPILIQKSLACLKIPLLVCYFIPEGIFVKILPKCRQYIDSTDKVEVGEKKKEKDDEDVQFHMV